MNRQMIRILGKLALSAAVALALSGCAAKLTTVRPAEVSALVVERLCDGETVSLPSQQGDADRKDTLIFQLEEPYLDAGPCAGEEEHRYLVRLYIGEKLDTELFIETDGSACKNGRRRVPAQQAQQPVAIADWDALFERIPAESSSETEPASLLETADTPQPLQNDFSPAASVPAAELPPWSYCTGDARIGDEAYAVLWRETQKGDAEWLCRVAQTEDGALRHAIDYIGGSLEASGGRFLYFTVTDAATFHRSLWRFGIASERCVRLLDAPCSNMVLLQDAPAALQGRGWIVCGDRLVAVDLTGGSCDDAMTIPLAEHISEDLFFGLGAFGTHKFAELTDLGGGLLRLDAVVAEPETSAPEQRQSYELDVAALLPAAQP